MRHSLVVRGLIAALFASTLGWTALLPAQNLAAPPGARPAATAADRSAAEAIDAYLGEHMKELSPQLKAAKFNPDGGPEEYRKLKPFLPADLAPSLEAAIPLFIADRTDDHIALNLKVIGAAMLLYAKQNGNILPMNFGQVLLLVPNKNVFFLPNAALPAEFTKGTRPEQAAWINAHTDYVFPGAGRSPALIGSRGVIAAERPDHDPAKARLAVLYADGSVELLDRAKAVALLR